MQERQVVHEQCHYYLRGAQLDDYATLEEEDEDGKHVELYLDPQVQQAFLSTSTDDAGNASVAHETAVLKVYAAAKAAVIKRDTDLLTKEEVSRLSREVSAAILEELTIWVKYKCFA